MIFGCFRSRLILFFGEIKAQKSRNTPNSAVAFHRKVKLKQTIPFGLTNKEEKLR
jgi:hypothetical protein